MPSSFTDQRWGRWGNKVKRPLILQISPGMASLRQGDVLIPVFLLLTGGQGSKQREVSLAVRQKGRILWGRPLCVIIITKATERKSKKQFQHGVRSDFSLQQLHLQELIFCATVLDHLYTRWPQSGPGSWLGQSPPVEYLVTKLTS